MSDAPKKRPVPGAGVVDRGLFHVAHRQRGDVEGDRTEAGHRQDDGEVLVAHVGNPLNVVELDLTVDPGQSGRVEVGGRCVIGDGDKGVAHRRRPADPDLEERGPGGADLGKRGLGRRDERRGRQERQGQEERDSVFHGCLL
jgi:hypothetical protein